VSVNQPVKFLVVGAGGYLVNLAVFAWLLRLGVPYLLDSIVSYFISNALMYLGNRYYTFSLGHDGFWAAYVRYILVGLVVAGLNAIVLAILVETAGLYAVYAQAISLLLITPVAFVLNKRWTFRNRVAHVSR
jgi:putative flippase GtrA